MNIMRLIWDERGSTRTIILAVVFIVLLIATINQRIRTKTAEKEAQEIAAAPLVDINVDDVYTIEIYELLSKTILEKHQGKWRVGAAQVMPGQSEEEKQNAPLTAMDYADENAVMEVLETIQDGLRNWELVSINREKKIQFRVGALGSKFIFKNEKGDVLACVDVGEKSADFTGTYVSLCDQDEIYKIPGILEYIFKRDFNGWRTKQIYELDKDKIIKFSIKSADQAKPITIEKGTDGNWTGTSPKEFIPDKKRTDSLLTSFCIYKASGFPDSRMGPEEMKIENVELELTATFDDGKTYALTFGTAERSPGTLVMPSDREMIYTANQPDVEKYKLSVEDLSMPEEESP